MSSERHLSAVGFEGELAAHAPLERPIPGSPSASIFITPGAAPEAGLRVACAAGAQASPIDLEHVKTRSVRRRGEDYLEIVVSRADLFLEAYPMLCAVADRIQVDALSFDEAVGRTLRRMGQLLRRESALTTEQEIGLVGELLVFLGLANELGATEAARAWHSDSLEEHDFSVRDTDIEVKTTSGERRTHWIQSLTQLVESPDRPLWLISHQLTKTSDTAGWRLPKLIERARQAIGSGVVRDAFEAHLFGAGWREDYEETCRTHWTRRAPSLAFLVKESFPRLTADMLHAAGASMDRVQEVKYKLDLSEVLADAPSLGYLQSALTYGGRA
ncbi:PD-(D/E)XK motif protein [Kutzneria sp. NPDC052558]|uniref:PD-(D/E)XK motif protein n=1 Tax=Kutzneria sp. NPDC052558 TaxID=3364121 RepID=UPI0037C4FE31